MPRDVTRSACCDASPPGLRSVWLADQSLLTVKTSGALCPVSLCPVSLCAGRAMARPKRLQVDRRTEALPHEDRTSKFILRAPNRAGYVQYSMCCSSWRKAGTVCTAAHGLGMLLGAAFSSRPSTEGLCRYRLYSTVQSIHPLKPSASSPCVTLKYWRCRVTYSRAPSSPGISGLRVCANKLSRRVRDTCNTICQTHTK